MLSRGCPEGEQTGMWLMKTLRQREVEPLSKVRDLVRVSSKIETQALVS